MTGVLVEQAHRLGAGDQAHRDLGLVEVVLGVDRVGARLGHRGDGQEIADAACPLLILSPVLVEPRVDVDVEVGHHAVVAVVAGHPGVEQRRRIGVEEGEIRPLHQLDAPPLDLKGAGDVLEEDEFLPPSGGTRRPGAGGG